MTEMHDESFAPQLTALLCIADFWGVVVVVAVVVVVVVDDVVVVFVLF